MIKIIGPRDKRDISAINTTSHSPTEWTTGLSPFHLGPILLYRNHTALIFENAWQFAKLYPEHADANGQPTADYWNWAKSGWSSQRPFRYPLGKGRKPLCSLWNGQRLDYITARKEIYLPLYQNAVAGTAAYQKLEAIYRENGSITLFDFDGYDHLRLGMNLTDVLNCKTRICGHAVILACMLTHGTNFTLKDLPAATNRSAKNFTTDNLQALHPITIVNIRTFQGESEYIGRRMPGRNGSPLRNEFKVKPHGPYERTDSVQQHYRKWLWEKMQNRNSREYLEILRLAKLGRQRPLNLSCWCAPELCHGEVIKKAVEYLIHTGVDL